MEVEIKIDTNCIEPKIVLFSSKKTQQIDELKEKIQTVLQTPQMIIGYKNYEAKILDQKTIYKIFTYDQKIYAQTQNGEYLLKIRLYEAEQILDSKIFVRISNAEIINIQKVKNFDLSITGTIRVVFLDGNSTFASRRYVSKIKTKLGI